ncbi:hypothetical protein OED01_02475 [Microbacterium sp. M28]|uniref:hypothetical protein n=1 Tax=Microbacterium sp. M28 TaxID=2962064 RepID=UPI0021F43B5F|nr:hypothetical protein [Microbacterium sp. M28]UYO97619.1 hypothetical protein OED01_02475 [Microbacterium sp. M28]
MSDPNAEIRTLQARVDQLERMLVGTYALVIALALVLGLVLPYATQRSGEGDEKAWSVLSTVFTPIPAPETESFGVGLAVVVGFIILIVLTVVILVGTLIPAALGILSDGLRIMGRVLAILGIIGAVLVLVLSVQAMGTVGGDFGAGGPVLLFGMIGVLPLVSRSARSLVWPRA